MITIRRIRPGEAELFRQIRLASLRDAPYAFSSTVESAERRSAESWQEQADRTARGGDRATFIAFSEAAPVGIAALYRLDDQAEVGELLQVWVHPEHRGTGLARELMDVIFQWAVENNFRTIKAIVTEGNSRAVKFYIKHGFSVVHDPSLPGSNDVCLVKGIHGA